MRDFVRDTLSGFRRALEAGVVREPAWHFRASSRWVSAVLSSPRPAPSIASYSSFEQAEIQPGTMVHWEHSYALQAHPGPIPYPVWCIELARVSCGDSETAVLKAFEQVYRIARQDELSCPWWGDPFRLWPDRIRWHFRVEPFTGVAIPQWNVVGVVQLPGDPQRETPVFEDLWFPAGSSSANNIHVTVGPRQLLRVVAEVPAADVQPFVAAKIRGFRFRAFSPANVPALKTIW